MEPVLVAHEMPWDHGSYSIRPCDECGAAVPFDNPDADVRVCDNCNAAMAREP